MLFYYILISFHKNFIYLYTKKELKCSEIKEKSLFYITFKIFNLKKSSIAIKRVHEIFYTSERLSNFSTFRI